MATCKDCLHREACMKFNKVRVEVLEKTASRGADELCDIFTDKSRFIELPDYKSLFYTAESMLEQWNETTGAIPPSTSWYYELLSIIEDTVKLSFGAGILYKAQAEAAIGKGVRYVKPNKSI